MKLLIKEKRWIIGLFLIALFSFLLNLYALLQYDISYGPDGPYYDIQVREIIRNGYPDSNDPPLVYYYMCLFVIAIGNSYLGIKISMALISALMTIPAFLLTEIFSEKLEIESKIPSLLCAFLITINMFTFRMIEDFMQNLVGNFFVLWFLLFAIKWFENLKRWLRYGVPTALSFVCSILSHVFAGAVAMVLIAVLFLFNIIIKTIKLRKIPLLELVILLALIGLIAGALVLSIYVFPSIYSNFQTRLNSYLNSLSSDSDSGKTQTSTAYLLVLTIPFIIGFIPTCKYLIKGIRSKRDDEKDPPITRKTFLAFSYVALSLLFIFLVAVPSEWMERFTLLAFMPIALVVPVGVKAIDRSLLKFLPEKHVQRKVLVSAFALIMASASLIRVFQMIPDMGPVISEEQYDELVEIRDNYISSQVDPEGVICVDSMIGFGYWVKYVLDMETRSGNASTIASEYPGQPIYGVYEIKHADSPFHPVFNYPWNPLLPFRQPENGELGIAQTDQPPEENRDIEGLPIYTGEYIILVLIYNSDGTPAGGGA